MKWLKIFFFLAIHESNTQLVGVEEACSGISCNNGSLTFGSDWCRCVCLPLYTGLQCEIEIEASKWPVGPYATPMPKYGCPEQEGRGWKTGYLNMTFTKNLTEFSSPVFTSPSRHSWNNVELLGPYTDYMIQMNFCYKTDMNLTFLDSWPPGNYGIYRAGGICPVGFTSIAYKMILPPLLQYNTDGHLPDLSIDKNDTSFTSVTMHVCERQELQAIPVNLDWSYPFIFLQGSRESESDKSCPTFPGLSTKEGIIPVMQFSKDDSSFTKNYNKTFAYCFYKDIASDAIPGPVLFWKALRSSRTTSLCPRVLTCVFHDELLLLLRGSVFFTTWQSTTRPWIIMDMEHTISMSYIILTLDSKGHAALNRYAASLTAGQNVNQVYLPVTIASSQKWSFLNSGGVKCADPLQMGRMFGARSMTVFLMQNSTERPLHGRYLALTDEAPYGARKIFQHISEIAVIGSGTGCGKEMGMRDLGISDFQITASSSKPDHPASFVRPDLQGWCSRADDVDPYLQVDFLVATIVEGISIYNWVSTINHQVDNAFQPKLRPNGIKMFSIEHGFTMGSLTEYTDALGKKTFFIDKSLPYTDVQTFVFETKILASIVRIHPSSVNGDRSTCMKLEIIGCRQKNIKSLDCGENSTKFWTETETAYVTADSLHTPLKLTNASKTECMDYCEINHTKCAAIMFNNVSDTCSIYTMSSWLSLSQKTKETNTTLHQLLCLDGLAMETRERRYKNPTLRLLGYGEILMDVEQRINFSNIVSFGLFGYPFSYNTGMTIVWDISLTNSGYLVVIFTNISLNTYDIDAYCKDAILLAKEVIYSKENPQQISMGAHNILQVLNRTMNGKQIAFSFGIQRIIIVYNSCTAHGTLSLPGYGFRAILNQSETEVISKSSVRDFQDIASVIIVSNSFLGIDQLVGNHNEAWSINGYYKYMYILLKITEFDINCKVGSTLEVKGSNERTLRYCNLKRPVGTIRSTQQTLELRLYSAYGYRHFQGFKAAVKIIKPSADFESKNIHSHVCADVFGKCYRFVHISPYMEDGLPLLSAEGAEGYCIKRVHPESTLVHLRNQKEAEFIMYKLHRIKSNDLKKQTRITEYADYTYNGLVTQYRRNKLLETWSNGKPVTYATWRKGHLRQRTAVKQCTRMGIYSLYKSDTWEAIPCDTPKAEYFVCEVPFKKYYESLYKSLSIIEGRIPHSPSYRFFNCGSEEKVSRLFLCDGLNDCLDASDETNCPTKDIKSDCPPDSFRCSDGTCVLISVYCDHVLDCADGSDEYCDFPPCKADDYRCKNRQCINRTLRCDSKKDCWDGSDELECSTCQERSYRCVDLTCIPVQAVCDGVVDCVDSGDENNCEPVPKTSCKEWWLSGFHTTGEYMIGNNKVECNFDLLNTTGVIQTIYYNIEGDSTKERNLIIVSYGSKVFIDSLAKRQTCVQHVTQSCTPPLDIVANTAAVGNNTDFWPCLCLRYIVGYNSFQIEACSDETRELESSRGHSWLESLAHIERERNVPILKMYIKPFSDTSSTWIRFEGIVCEEEFTPIYDTIKCRNGKLVSYNETCLYRTDGNGRLLGCRDMTHLQGCDTFHCPDGFIKCPNSYCLSSSLLCDGQNQCPDGEDEINCWCGNVTSHTMMIFQESNRDLEEVVRNMATQFYKSRVDQNGSNVLLAKYLVLPSTEPNRQEVQIQIEYYKSRILEPVNIAFSFLGSLNESIANILQWFNETTIRGETAAVMYVQNKDTVHVDGLQQGFHDIKPNELDIHLYVVYIGGDNNDYFQSDQYRTNFPSKTSFVYIKNSILPETFALSVFSSICPAPSDPVCSGMYRCRAARQCLNASLLCDGDRQCPYGDDERLCDFECPENCDCYGYSIHCGPNTITTEALTKLPRNTRSIDISGNSLSKSPGETDLPYLLTLNMSQCNLNRIPVSFLKKIPNLKHLDLSFNFFTVIMESDLANQRKLSHISLSGNYELKEIASRSFRYLLNIKTLTLQETKLTKLKAGTFSGLNLRLLDLSNNQISEIEDGAFSGLRVETLNLKQNKIATFSRKMFFGVSSMKNIISDAYKFCCVRPDFVEEVNCKPHRDEFSSCEDLMRNEALRFLLWVIGFCAFIGNILSLLYRLKFDRKRLQLGYGIFVTNLAISDFLMGMYLLTIAIADLSFRGSYIFKNDWWRSSYWCNMAGVLATTSSEASVLFMCLITLDRLIVVKYPFGDIRFGTRSATAVAIVAWMFVLVIAILPLTMVSYFENKFYSRTGVCLALPLTTTNGSPGGSAYSAALFIGLNFATFLLIVIGQLLIYKEIRASSKRMNKARSARVNDLRIARNLLLVVATDFLCWFPIGIMGLTVIGGHVISADVYSWSAVLILPVNSALNPFLYTFSAIIGKKVGVSISGWKGVCIFAL